MSSDRIPEWAWKRAYEEAYGPEPDRFDSYRSQGYRISKNNQALARYIAAHEEPPFDPIEVEVDRILQAERTHPDSTVVARRTVRLALERGMELARLGAP